MIHRDRLVVVTGSEGFIGSHLVERLLDAGYPVRALVQYNSNGSLGWLAELGRDYGAQLEIMLGDVRDREMMQELTRDASDVIHLAALISIPYSYVAPRSYIETNVIGTMNVLEGAKVNGVQKIICTSTSEVYGTPDTVPIGIGHPLRAQSPYAASKIASDQLAISYAATYGMNVAVLRPFNTYGPRQSRRAVIPTILAQMLAGQEIVRLGSLHTIRDFTFVTDTVAAFVRVLEMETNPGAVIQLGSGEAVSVADLVTICREVTGSTCKVEIDQKRLRPEASEVQILLADPEAAQRAIGWTATVGLSKGIAMTAQWMEQGWRTERAGTYSL